MTTDKEGNEAHDGAKAASSGPLFSYRGVILSPEQLRYSPHPDIIYPSVIESRPQWGVTLARYYMYYAPHDAPGGICLAFSEKPEGPWREYDRNPIITREWATHYQVSHVSSPHAIWNPEEQRVFLYYHGENSVTRFASSSNGIDFEYGGTAVDTGMFEEGLTEASYARVHRVLSAAGQGSYVMFIMGNHMGTRNVYRAWSKDGRRWVPDKQAFLKPPPGTGQMGPGSVLEWNGHTFLICCASLENSSVSDPVSDLYLYEINSALDQATYLRMLISHDAVSADNPRISDPYVFEASGRVYLFVSVGHRLQQRIALAIADPVSNA